MMAAVTIAAWQAAKGSRTRGCLNELVGLDNRWRDPSRGGARLRECAVLPRFHWQRGHSGRHDYSGDSRAPTLVAVGDLCRAGDRFNADVSKSRLPKAAWQPRAAGSRWPSLRRRDHGANLPRPGGELSGRASRLLLDGAQRQRYSDSIRYTRPHCKCAWSHAPRPARRLTNLQWTPPCTRPTSSLPLPALPRSWWRAPRLS